jgi:large subunit ribosomal protein L32e
MSDAEKKRLMKTRKKINQKRPHFTQFESWRFVRIKDHWKRPKGIDNHMRQQKRGWPKVVKVGYGGPKSVRNLHPSGLEEVMVYTISDLALIDPETQVARLGGSVGKKKRISILEEANNQGVKVLNPGKAKGLVESEPQTENDLDVETDSDLDEDKEDSQ